MKLISEKFKKLKPRKDYLLDQVVMTHAWKKAHSYIRHHNWYADTLALDISALGLEKNVKIWAEELASAVPAPYPLELVPAAKSEKWVVSEANGWIAHQFEKDRAKKPPIRPLAHLTIRDQVWATTLMMCMADAVESSQGDCSEASFSKARREAVFSYGNRLLCEWGEDARDGWFRWGNTELYRKFFQDYQAFLRRPVEIGREASKGLAESSNIYVVSLDLSKFYDRIDRKILIERLKEICNKYYGDDQDEEFWGFAEQILDWQWSEESKKRAKNLSIELPRGLPQGLAPAGFFANAYLLNFDNRVGEGIGGVISADEGVTLHDYCRYVDDIRLVVSVDDGVDVDQIAAAVNVWIGRILKKYGGVALEINSEKTKIRSLADLDNAGTLSGKIAIIQGELSGPADRDVLESAQGVLEGLLTTQSDGIPEKVSFEGDQALLKLARFDNDVRPDTLKRFAANRLASIIKKRRRINDASSGDSGVTRPIDNECELLAKKLIWAWMQDPSLALLLRKAIEIFPSPEIAEPVFESIYRRTSISNKAGSQITSAMFDYLLADLFRSCVDFNGYFQIFDYPENANPDAVIEVACRFAQKAVASRRSPGYLRRQALLLLAVKQKPVDISNSEESIQHTLHAILAGKEFELKRQRLALFEVAAQITGRPESIGAQLIDAVEGLAESEVISILEDLARRGGELWESVWLVIKKRRLSKNIVDSVKWAAPVTATELGLKECPLSKIIVSNKNGFSHEAALLKLGISLVRLSLSADWKEGISPRYIRVTPISENHKSVDWGEIWLPGVREVRCKFSKADIPCDPRYVSPAWLNSSNKDSSRIYWIGAVLRACAVGSLDFTSMRMRKGKVVNYKGLRTEWFKRRMGMIHAPESLVGNYATVSDWFSELLMRCLQWPGFESNYIDNKEILGVECLADLEALLSLRLGVLDAAYCQHSKMPSVITTIRRPDLKARPFRLVCVQQILPRTSDFSAVDPRLGGGIVRARNRDHLSRVCNLTYKTLCAKVQAGPEIGKSVADLIVFPEVAIHVDDQDIIKSLSDKTGAIIFAGVIFTDVNGRLVNLARWFIPDFRKSGRRLLIRDQGKAYPTASEKPLGVIGYRPCQHIIRIAGNSEGDFSISGAICYDATDLSLAADLKDKTDLFVVAAHNKDVRTFDAMASALHYHMYQHVAVVNKGEFGGSTVQAPYKESFDKLIFHSHGGGQISIGVADLDLMAFRRAHKSFKEVKTRPAGMKTSEVLGD